jgi:hypothetical protein
MHSWLIVGVFFDRVGCWFGGCIRHVVVGFSSSFTMSFLAWIAYQVSLL